MQIVSNVALITVNETLLVQLVSFLIFLFIINRVMFRPLRLVMRERAVHIDQLQADIKDAGKAYDGTLERIREQEATVRAAALDLKQKREAEGEAEAHGIIESVKTEISAIRRQTQEEVDRRLDEARSQIASEAGDLADAIVSQLLKKGAQK
jgi:F-type H+-transporting ATPase subunit b